MEDNVVQEGATVLRGKASPILPKDISSPALQELIARMKETLAGEQYGVAIAAPQVGSPLRLFVVAGSVFTPEMSEEDEEEDIPIPADRVFINPELTRLSRAKQEMSEGCLSVRGKYGTVMRHEKATIKALDEHGKPFTHHASGLLAQIFQHECDHLEGILYTDKATHLEVDEDMKSARTKLKDKHGI